VISEVRALLTGCNNRKSEDIMERTLKRVCTGALLGAALLLVAACTTHTAQCKGGYPDGGGIQDMSPYSPSPGSHQPACEPK
jgi:ABC-type enterobactin transport system permease subunit